MTGPLGFLFAARRERAAKADTKHNPWQGYAALLNAERPKSPEDVAADRERIHDYYREKVLRERAGTDR